MMDPGNEIASLDPSKGLLDYYRKKISDHEEGCSELMKLLERYKHLSHPIELEEERCQLKADLFELREALSDINIYLYAERQQVADLLLEQEKLKVDLDICEKKKNLLCSLTTVTEEELEVYIRNPKKKGLLLAQIPPRLQYKEGYTEKEVSTSKKCLEALEQLKFVNDHYTKSKCTWQEEKATILEDRALQQKEARVQMQQDQVHMKLLAAKLEESQKLLQESLKSSIEAKSELLEAKRHWLAEKDRLMNDLKKQKYMAELYPDDFREINRSLSHTNLAKLSESCEVRHIRKEMKAIERQLKDEEEKRIIYEKRCTLLEQEKCKLKEEKEAEESLFKSRLKRIKEQKDLLVKQNEKLDERRKCQLEGLASSIKLVKDELKKIIHQLYKLTEFYNQNENLFDATKAKEIKDVSSLARAIHLAIVESKKKLLKIEASFNDI